MIIWETDETRPKYFNDGGSTPDEGLTRRHGDGAIMGIMDAHVEFIKWKKHDQLLQDPNKNVLWCYPETSNGNTPSHFKRASANPPQPRDGGPRRPMGHSQSPWCAALEIGCVIRVTMTCKPGKACGSGSWANLASQIITARAGW